MVKSLRYYILMASLIDAFAITDWHGIVAGGHIPDPTCSHTCESCMRLLLGAHEEVSR